ncbi:MAG: DHHA1 domain-containing protein [Candidatus Melainabacteria bacterium]|nr:DHHA1 domain-containing protein [Candidatus Melainabacteria bacterium]
MSTTVENDYLAIRQALSDAKHVFLTAHVGPDGDALGAMLGCYHALRACFPQVERVDCGVSGKVPAMYSFLPGLGDIVDVDTATHLLSRYDVAMSFDCGSLDRLGQSARYFEQAAISINVDHHISNRRFGSLNLLETDAAASGQVVYNLLRFLNADITKPVADCLYTAIMTDTGGFKYSNATSVVFQIAGHLVSLGADPEMIYKRAYEMRPWCQVQLQAEVVRRAEKNAAGTLAWTVITLEDLNAFGADHEHVDGVVETLRHVETVLISAIFKETRDGHTKVSLRSNSHQINVAQLLELHGGGGHAMAAGCTLKHPPLEAVALLRPQLEAAIETTLKAPL